MSRCVQTAMGLFRRLRAVTQALAALLAVGGLLAPVAGALHAASSRHAPCLEHGEMLEADGPAHAPRDHARHSGAQFEAAGQSQAHGHEHCALLSLAHSRALPSCEAPRGLPLASLSESLPAAPGAAPRASLPLLHLAPKGSPPPAARG